MTTGTADADVFGQDHPRDTLDRADQLLAGGRADEAVVLLRRVAQDHPHDAGAWHRLAAALLASNGGPEADTEARRAAERAVTLDPSSAIGYRMVSEAALRLDDPESALATMRAAVHAAPESWVAHLDLAAALMKLPDGGPEAWQIAREAARLAPDRPEPHLMLGDLGQQAGDPHVAAAAYSDALDRDPGNELATRKLAELHHQLATAPPEPSAQPVATAEHRPARLFGNGLAVLSLLTVLASGMLMMLAPGRAATWFGVVSLVATGGLALLGGVVLTGVRRGAPGALSGAGYRLAVGLAVLTVVAAGVMIAIGGLLSTGTFLLRAALCLSVAGFAAAHLAARFADRADNPVGDDRQAQRMRAGAYLSLALGGLAHAVTYLVLAGAGAALPQGAFQVLAVVAVVALVFAFGVQAAAKNGLTRVHQQRFSWRPWSVIAAVVCSGLVDLVGASGALGSLFAPVSIAVLLVAAFLGFVLATSCALAAVNLRS
ncbi:MAG: tetratricopeptide repeat protein [Actinocatenispora sp.]